MFQNHFKIAFRNLWRNKASSFINLFGLSVGLTAAVFIFLWVRNELSFDTYHPDAGHIYRLTSTIPTNKDEFWVWEVVPMQMGPAAANGIPEVEQSARAYIRSAYGPTFRIGNQLVQEKTSAYVDQSWFRIFHYDFVAGDTTAFAHNPFSIILTQTEAKKYFGKASMAVGKVIRVETVNYTVEGVVKDNPLNSSFSFDAIMNLEGMLSIPDIRRNDNSWNNFDYVTFLKLRSDAQKTRVELKLTALLNKNREIHTAKISLEPLGDMYFESDLQSSNLPHGNKKTTYIFCLLAVVLLVIACINYVNLTTAKASLRAKEVSVRKIVGARRTTLFLQFVAESLAMGLIALMITIMLLQVCLPLFNSITEMPFSLPMDSISLWQVLLGTILMVIVLNGIYPALLLSSFSPLNVFRGKSVLKLKDGAIRKGLVIFQFTLSMMLITGTLVMYRQMRFIQTTDPGYNIAQVLTLQVPWKKLVMMDQAHAQTYMTAMKSELERVPGVLGVCNGAEPIVNVGSFGSGNADWEGRDTAFNPTIARFSGDADFKNLFHLQMAAGRWFTGDQERHAYILNETAAHQFHMHQPIIGQRFIWGGDTGQIIGIVKDFHFKSLHEKIGPMVISNSLGSDPYFYVKVAPGNIQKTVRAISHIWSKFADDEPYSYTFLDDTFNNLYKRDLKTSRLILIFSVIAIVISALGLFGLATFTAEQRTKEIGIRKVLGASVRQIIAMLSKDFVRLVVIALLIASPLAWWVMNKWLQDFAYRIDLSVWLILGAGGIALLVAVLSVSVQAVRSATVNPVKSLHTE